MFKTLLLPVFLLVCLVQWLIPSQIIWKKEKVLARGRLYKFRTAPIDPVDPFRGRYIILNFAAGQFTQRGKKTVDIGDKVYAVFGNDPRGFARIDSLSMNKPINADYIKTTVDYIRAYEDSSVIFVTLPFNKFYMEESKAPEAETIYGNRSRDTTQSAYALVSVFEGDAVVKNVFVNDTSISEIISRQPK